VIQSHGLLRSYYRFILGYLTWSSRQAYTERFHMNPNYGQKIKGCMGNGI